MGGCAVSDLKVQSRPNWAPNWIDFPVEVTEVQVDRAVRDFSQMVKQQFGSNIAFFLVGSRARGNHRPDSDADVAVVFGDGDWSKVRRIGDLAEIAFDSLMAHGVYIQAHPFRQTDWDGDGPDHVIASMKADSVRINPE
jgi:predicted nucleotidyltransferase